MARKYAKKGNKKRGKRGAVRKMTNVNKSLGPLLPAQRYITSMKYSQTFTISSALGAVQRFNLNNIYDPDRTGVGHQPYGYDQLGAIYNRYRVIACHWAINVYPSTGTAQCVSRLYQAMKKSSIPHCLMLARTHVPSGWFKCPVPQLVCLRAKYIFLVAWSDSGRVSWLARATLERSSRRQCCAQHLCPGNE